jgi:hypothetical protein
VSIYSTNHQSNRPPIPASSSSSTFGSGFFYSFFPAGFLSSFLASTTGADEAAGTVADEVDAAPPKLKNELISFPSSALANNLAQ